MADGYLNFDTKINTKGYDKGVQSLSQSLGELKKGLLGIAAAAGVAFSVKAIVDFGKQAVTLASDLQEVQNVVDTAFGDMSHKMEQFADTAIEMYGISKLTAKQTGSTFMAMASGMGIASDAASDMAVSLTGLSADIASFYNVAQDVSSTALKSIFTGETETLKQFGIVMTEANLQSYALSQGITKSLKAMTQAEKVQLRYNYVMAQTALAQGDFAKTSGGWANQLRILSEQWKEFSSTIGQVLVQVLLPALTTLNSVMAQVVSWTKAAANALAELFGWQLDASSAAGSMSSALANCADDYASMADAAEAAAAANERSLAIFDEIHTIGSEESGVEKSNGGSLFSLSSVTTMISDTNDTTKEIGSIFDTAFGNVNFDPLIHSFHKLTEAAEPIVEDISDGLHWLWSEILQPLGVWFIEDAAPASLDVFSGALDILGASIDAVKPYGEWIWDHFLQPLAKWTGEIITDGLEVLADTLHEIADWIRENPDAAVKIGAVTIAFIALYDAIENKKIGSTLSALKTGITNLGKTDVTVGVITTGIVSWGYAITEVHDNWDDLVDVVEESGGTWNFLCDWVADSEQAINDFFDTTKFGESWNDFWQGVGEAIYDFSTDVADFVGDWKDHWEDVGESVYDCAEDIKLWFEDAYKNISGVFTDIKEGFADVWEDVSKGAKRGANWVIEKLNGIGGAVEKLLNSVVDGLNNALSFDIPKNVPFIGGSSFGLDIPHVNIPEIPKLATGTVVPAGFGEFTAILGDNKREPEIVSPESYMKKAFLDALKESGITAGGGTTVIQLMVDGKKLAEVVNRENQRSGRARNGTR
ncbi:MAG: hypothetical protein ACI4J3_07425 [Oscillospiraceae bacterium]